VPSDYTVDRRVAGGDKSVWPGVPYAADYRVTKHHKAHVQHVQPRYFEGDDWSPANLPPDQIWSVQQRMIAAGLIPKGAEIRKGYWDDTTRQAYRQLLGEANGAGFSADQQLTVRENSEAINKQRSQAASVYLRPDPATLRSTARKTLADVLGDGHKPTDQEVERLSSCSAASPVSSSTRRSQPMTRRARRPTAPGRRRSRTSIRPPGSRSTSGSSTGPRSSTTSRSST
jgi:hypothetical protein